jgi:hypothetical protein
MTGMTTLELDEHLIDDGFQTLATFERLAEHLNTLDLLSTTDRSYIFKTVAHVERKLLRQRALHKIEVEKTERRLAKLNGRQPSDQSVLDLVKVAASE